MNDAQLFVLFFFILTFGWMGFLAGRAWEASEDKIWYAPAIVFFMMGSIGLLIGMAIHLIVLVGKNF